MRKKKTFKIYIIWQVTLNATQDEQRRIRVVTMKIGPYTFDVTAKSSHYFYMNIK